MSRYISNLYRNSNNQIFPDDPTAFKRKRQKDACEIFPSDNLRFRNIRNSPDRVIDTYGRTNWT